MDNLDNNVAVFIGDRQNATTVVVIDSIADTFYGDPAQIKEYEGCPGVMVRVIKYQTKFVPLGPIAEQLPPIPK
jgi:hypothetical protein